MACYLYALKVSSRKQLFQRYTNIPQVILICFLTMAQVRVIFEGLAKLTNHQYYICPMSSGLPHILTVQVQSITGLLIKQTTTQRRIQTLLHAKRTPEFNRRVYIPTSIYITERCYYYMGPTKQHHCQNDSKSIGYGLLHSSMN